MQLKVNTEVNRSTKGNIKIKKELLGKYENVREIFDSEKKNINRNIYINYESEKIEINDVNNIKIEKIKNLAYEIFEINHQTNTFSNNNNNNNKILVCKTGISESVEKICNNYSQRKLLFEHLKIFSVLGKIIENAKLVNQVYERKERKKYNSWHYYTEGVIINNKNYLLEFEVVAMDNGENHYRVQRLEIL